MSKYYGQKSDSTHGKPEISTESDNDNDLDIGNNRSNQQSKSAWWPYDSKTVGF